MTKINLEFHKIDYKTSSEIFKILGFRIAPQNNLRNISILYLPGFGDSFLNHIPFFDILAREGYEIVGFDYPGSGSARGSLSKMRIIGNKEHELRTIAKFVWEILGTNKEKKIALSWCIGSLVALQLAYEKWLTHNIMLAPSYKSRVGTAFLFDREKHLSSINNKNDDTHIIPIRPRNPLQVLPFSLNIKISARKIEKLKIPQTVKGLVFATADKDEFIHGGEYLKRRVQETAPHFEIVDFSDSKHEIHNESVEIRDRALQKIIHWLGQI